MFSHLAWLVTDILTSPLPGYPNFINDTYNTTFIDIVWNLSNFVFSPVIYHFLLVLSRFGANVPVISPCTVCAMCNIGSFIVHVHYISLCVYLCVSLYLSLSLSLSSPIQVFQTMHRFRIRCSQLQAMLQWQDTLIGPILHLLPISLYLLQLVSLVNVF